MIDFNYIYRFIPFLVFLHPFILANRRKNKIATFICGLYFASAVGSLFISSKYLIWHDFQNDTWQGFLLYSIYNLPLLYLSLYLKPLEGINNIKFDILTTIFVAFLGVGAIFSTIYQMPYALNALSLDAYEVRYFQHSILPSNIFTTIAVGFSTFFIIYLFYFFVGLINKWNKLITFSMLLGALSFVINVLTVSGRDGFVLFILSFVLAFLLFENHLNEKLKKKIKLIGFFLGIIFFTIFFIITANRFSDINDGNLLSAFNVGVLNYFSMQPFTFNDVLKYHDTFSYGRGSFPLFYSWFFEIENTERDVSMAYMYNFAGYIGSFYKNGAFLFTTFFVGLFYLIFIRIKFMYKKYYIYQFSIISLYIFFMTSGLFYFRLGDKGGNLYILLSIIMLVIFRKGVTIKN